MASIDDEELIRRLAEHQVDRLSHMAKVAVDQLGQMSNWLTASLLALNGAGGLAVANAAERLAAPLYPAAIFGIGIALALLSGFAIQAVSSRVLAPLELYMVFWRRASILGEATEAEEREAAAPIHQIGRWRLVPPTLGWLSAPKKIKAQQPPQAVTSALHR
jgi:hypothetical protein